MCVGGGIGTDTAPLPGTEKSRGQKLTWPEGWQPESERGSPLGTLRAGQHKGTEEQSREGGGNGRTVRKQGTDLGA